MIGRLVGLVIGLAIAAAGFGLYKPLLAAKYETFIDFARLSLGPFDMYRTVISFLIMAIGVVVAVAALQRETSRKSTRPVLTMLDGEEPSHAQALVFEQPASDHDEHGRDDSQAAHAHDDHGHDDHGEDDHGHDHDEHAHERENAHHH
jgi:hypothetical protein